MMSAPPRSKGIGAWGWVGIVTGVVALLCGGLVTALAGSTDIRPEQGLTAMPSIDVVTDPPSASEPPAVYKVGKTFRSGGFQYTVHRVKTGLTTVGNEYLRHKAQGSFTRLDVTVKNTEDQAVYFDADSRIKVEDKNGRRFSSDVTASVYGNSQISPWFTEINPGNSIRAFMYFDLPKGVVAENAVVSPGMLAFEADAIVPLS